MYRGIAHSGLSRIPTSRHAPIHRNPCYSCRQLSYTARLWKQLKPWEFRGNKSSRENAKIRKREFDHLVKERERTGGSRGSTDPHWSSVPPPVNRMGRTEFRARPPTDGTALTGSGTSFIWGKGKESAVGSRGQREAPPPPASAVLGRQRYDPKKGAARKEEAVAEPPPISWGSTTSGGNQTPWPAETREVAWNPPKIRTHISEDPLYWKDPVEEKREAERDSRVPKIRGQTVRDLDRDDYDLKSRKTPTQPYSHLDGELEPWGGERSELEEVDQESRERRQYLANYDARPNFRTHGRFEGFPGDGREMTEMTIVKKAARALPFTTHSSEFLYGYNICRLALKEKKRKIYKLHVYTGLMRQTGTIEKENILRKLAEESRIRVESTMDVSLLDAMSKGRPHNGFAIEAEPLEVPRVAYLVEPNQDGVFNAPIPNSTQYVQIRTKQQNRRPFVLVLDEVLDGGNFGAILRSAYFLGVDAVFIVSKNSTPATAVTSRASAGALECINYYDINHLASFIEKSQENGWKFYGAMPAPSQRELKASKQGRQTKWYDMEGLGDPTSRAPVALLLGNEADGLRPTIQKMMDAFVTIRRGEGVDVVVDSLNVGVAASILTHAFLYPAVKGSESVPAKDRRNEARDARLENQARAAENTLFQVDDGKYKAPRYEGTKLAAVASAMGSGMGEIPNFMKFDNQEVVDDPLKGWNPDDELVEEEVVEDSELVNEEYEENALQEDEDEGEGEDGMSRLNEDEDEWENENEVFSDDEDALEIGEDIMREAQEELASRSTGDGAEEEDEAISDEEWSDEEYWSDEEAVKDSNEQEDTFNSSKKTKAPSTENKAGKTSIAQPFGGNNSKELAFESSISTKNPTKSYTKEEVKTDIGTTTDDVNDQAGWEDVHEVIGEGVEKHEDWAAQNRLDKERKGKQYEWDAIKPTEPDFKAGLVGPDHLVDKSKHDDNSELTALIAKTGGGKPAPTKKKKNQNLPPPLKPELQEIADKLGFKPMLTKKQKKVLKKESKKLNQQLRKKVREDASKVRQELNKKRDPKVLEAVQNQSQKRNMEIASKNRQKPQGNKGKEKGKDFNYVKAGDWSMSGALQ
ncbi:hypothetical protein TWF281_007737 [Arthrobotrys megalospora]